MANELFLALADDLAQLIRLHDREVDGATLAALKAVAFPTGLALPPAGEAGAAAYANMHEALGEEISLDWLAADFSAIYLNNRLGASPYESVWLTDDHLACGLPMFEVREIYAAAGWQVTDWRQRFDDHLVLQLQFLQRQFQTGSADAEMLAAFIDEHIGYWLPDFAQRVSMYCDTSFYAALAELTHVWLLRCRELLADLSGLAVPTREEMTVRIQKKLAMDKAEVAPIRFMPGVQGPSW